ncbi:hypothetical protein [Luteococcus sp. OSA5]|uniref:hypothetical protein n=1 Tax=Luteococcus sp. OSA5 TaxID=3401630 RepID=UPI003B439CD0
MEEFFASIQPTLNQNLADEFALLLDAVAGQTPYAGAIATAEGLAWRVDLNTEEALATTIDVAGPRYAELNLDLDEAQLRWWPDEWQAVPEDPDTGMRRIASPTDETYALVRKYFETLDLDGDGVYEEWLMQASRFLARGLGSDEVRRVWAGRNVTPFLVVTETDGDAGPALEAFQELNASHPDQERYQEGLRYWQEYAG